MDKNRYLFVIVGIVAIVSIFVMVESRTPPGMGTQNTLTNDRLDIAGQAMKGNAKELKQSSIGTIFSQMVKNPPSPNAQQISQMFPHASIAQVFSRSGVFVSKDDLGRMLQ